MYRHVANLFVPAIAAILAAVFCAPCARADAIWHNDWYASVPPTLSNYWPEPYPYPPKPSAAVAFDAGGDVLFGAGSNPFGEYQYVRLAATGAQRWVANIDIVASQAGAYALIAAADGSAFLALGDPTFGIDTLDQVVKVEANGALAWSRGVPSGWLANVAPDRLASAGCTRLSLLDAANGNLIWQREINANRAWCAAGGVVADAQANLYATFQIPQGDATLGFRAIKFDANGNELWNIADTTVSDGSVVGIGGTLLYVGTATDVRALRVGDGSLAWSVPIETGAKIVLSTDGSPEPIVIGATSTRRLAQESGLSRWTQALVHVAGTAADLVGDGLVVSSANNLVKLDAATGAIAWTVALPSIDATGNQLRWLGYGGLDSGSFLAVARAQTPASAQGAPPPALQRIDFATGASVNALPAPSVAQGVQETDWPDDEGHVISTAVIKQSNGPALMLRSLDATSGVPAWQISESLFEKVDPYNPQVAVAVAGDAIAVTLPTWPYFYNPPSIGYPVVRLYDRATGNQRWEAALVDYNQTFTWQSAPAADANGDIIAASSGTVYSYGCGSVPCPRRSIYKLAAADGAILWQYNDSVPVSFQLLTLGNDILLVDSSNATIKGLSDADGSILWTASTATVGSLGALYPLPDGTIIVTGDAGWAKLDAHTGVIAWSSVYTATTCPPTCDASTNCNPCAFAYFGVTLTNGDLFFIATSLSDQTYAFRLHDDGSSLIDTWPLDMDYPGLDTGANSIFRDSLDQIWLNLQRRNHFLPGSVNFLTRFDMASGTLQGQQAISEPFDELNDSDYNTPLGPPADDRMLVSTSFKRAAQAHTSGVSLLDTTVAAQGDLAIEMTIDHTQVAPGALLGFHLTATYAGDQPISGAHLMAYLPWQTGFIDLACATTAASNCVLDDRSGNVHAVFNIQPGGSVDVTGQIRMSTTDGERTALSALVYGPTGLSEQDTSNNFTRTMVTQSLFRDGFDAN